MQPGVTRTWKLFLKISFVIGNISKDTPENVNVSWVNNYNSLNEQRGTTLYINNYLIFGQQISLLKTIFEMNCECALIKSFSLLSFMLQKFASLNYS